MLSGSEASAPPGASLETHILSPRPKPLASETLGMRPGICALTRPPGDAHAQQSLCVIIFEAKYVITCDYKLICQRYRDVRLSSHSNLLLLLYSPLQNGVIANRVGLLPLTSASSTAQASMHSLASARLLQLIKQMPANSWPVVSLPSV